VRSPPCNDVSGIAVPETVAYQSIVLRSAAMTGSARKPAICGTARPICSRIAGAAPIVGSPALRIGSAASAVVRVRRRRRIGGIDPIGRAGAAGLEGDILALQEAVDRAIPD